MSESITCTLNPEKLLAITKFPDLLIFFSKFYVVKGSTVFC